MVRMPFSAAGEFKAEVEHIAQSEDGKTWLPSSVT